MAFGRNNVSNGITLVILKESVKSFLRNNNFEMSIALASYGFFAIFPLLFFMSYIFGSYSGLFGNVMHGIESLIYHIFPNLNIFTVRDFRFPTGYKITWGILCLTMIVVSLMTISDSLRTAFFRIFNFKQEISVIKLQLMNFASAVIIITLFLTLIAIEILYLHIMNRFPEVVYQLYNLNILMSFVAAVLCMVTIYIVFPPIRIKTHRVIYASLITAIMLVLMKGLFSHFLSFNPDYGVAFGSLKMFFIMIVWVYYCFLVILFGAEIIVNIGKRDVLVLKRLFLGAEAVETIPETFINRYIKQFNKDDVVFHEGNAGDKMYFVVSGSVGIIRNNKVIRVMKKGDYFGEMSMLLDAPRTATVKIMEYDTRLVEISRENFDAILRESPDIVLAILKEMASRLRSTNERI